MNPSLLTSAVEATLRVVYPPCCLGCGARLAEAVLPVCRLCLRRIEQPSPEHVAAELARLPEAAVLEATFVLWRFDAGGTVQKLQHRLKYGNRPRLGVALGRHLGAALQPALPTPDAVLPIPLHRVRRYARGYNQSAMLARGVAEALGVRCEEGLLCRPRATRTQTRLSRRRRWDNVADAFAVTHPADATGRSFLLIDDVLTTGATLAAAAHAVRTAGAATLYAATLALAR